MDQAVSVKAGKIERRRQEKRQTETDNLNLKSWLGRGRLFLTRKKTARNPKETVRVVLNNWIKLSNMVVKE